MKYISASEKETKELAAKLVKDLFKKQREGALIFALSGQLGAGKTKFTQGVAEFLGIERNITSPTFVLMKRYPMQKNSTTFRENTTPMRYFESFYHFDCYRLHSSEELLDLEWEKIISNPRNIVFVEWAEKVKDILPPNSIHVLMKDAGENMREITVNSGSNPVPLKEARNETL